MKKLLLMSAVVLTSLFGLGTADAQDASIEIPVGYHETVEPTVRADLRGMAAPVPLNFPGRRFPATDDFPTGPDVGERVPEFTLPNQDGDTVDFYKDKGDAKAVLMFIRSAVW